MVTAQAFAEGAVDAAAPGRNRVCPGRGLALVIIEAFLSAFFKARASFRLGDDHTSTIQFKGSPTIHPTGFEFEVVSG